MDGGQIYIWVLKANLANKPGQAKITQVTNVKKLLLRLMMSELTSVVCQKRLLSSFKFICQVIGLYKYDIYLALKLSACNFRIFAKYLFYVKCIGTT